MLPTPCCRETDRKRQYNWSICSLCSEPNCHFACLLPYLERLYFASRTKHTFPYNMAACIWRQWIDNLLTSLHLIYISLNFYLPIFFNRIVFGKHYNSPNLIWGAGSRDVAALVTRYVKRRTSSFHFQTRCRESFFTAVNGYCRQRMLPVMRLLASVCVCLCVCLSLLFVL